MTVGDFGRYSPHAHEPGFGILRLGRGPFILATAIAATALVLGIRLVFAGGVRFCGGADACFYFSLAREIANRHDFLLNFVWNYQVGHVELPSNGLDYWRPGTSFLLTIAALFGDITLRSNAVLATLATILTALAAADFAWTLTHDRRISLLGYLIALCLPSFWTLALRADSSVFYGAAVSWFLVLFTPARRSRTRDVAALLCVAAACLIRNDAVLLVVPFAAVLAIRMAGQHAAGTLRHDLSYSFGLAVGFLLALLPPHLLTWYLSGHFGDASTAAVLFFHDLGDFSRYDSKADFASWWAMGVGSLVRQRVSAVMEIAHHLLTQFGEPATLMALVAASVGIMASPRGRFVRLLAGPAAFLVSIVLVYSMVLPGIGDHSAQRSYTAMLPVLAALAATGISLFAQSRPALMALALGVIGFSAIDGVNRARMALDDDRRILADYKAEARLIMQASPTPGSALAMVDNPAVFTTTTGIRSVSLPTDGPAAIRRAARHFKATAIVAGKWSEAVRASRWLREAPRWDVPNSALVVIQLSPNLGDDSG